MCCERQREVSQSFLCSHSIMFPTHQSHAWVDQCSLPNVAHVQNESALRQHRCHHWRHLAENGGGRSVAVAVCVGIGRRNCRRCRRHWCRLQRSCRVSSMWAEVAQREVRWQWKRPLAAEKCKTPAHTTTELSAAFSAGAAPRSREDIGSNAGVYGAERRECAIFFWKWQVLPPLCIPFNSTLYSPCKQHTQHTPTIRSNKTIFASLNPTKLLAPPYSCTRRADESPSSTHQCTPSSCGRRSYLTCN
jgi:hypothetical protein